MYHMQDGSLSYNSLFDLLVRYKKTNSHDPIKVEFEGIPLEISGVLWDGKDLTLNLVFNRKILKEDKDG